MQSNKSISQNNNFAYHVHFGCRVKSSGSQKAADSNVALRMNISAPVRSSDSAKISKNVASLVDKSQKNFLPGGCRLSVSDVISGGF